MSVFFKRKKLFEDDAQQQPAQNATVQQQNGGQPVQPANASTNNASTNANASTNQNNQQPVQQQPDPKAIQLNNEVTSCVDTIKKTVQQNDPYALISYDVPAVMQKMVPEFTKDNPDAKPTMDAWGAFKQQPSKDKFDAMINAFVKFGNGGQDASTNGSKVNPAPASSPEANNATQSQQQQESLNMTFSNRLQEKLNHNMKMTEYQYVIGKYFHDSENIHI